MPNILSPNTPLNDEQLKKAVERLVDVLTKGQKDVSPELKKSIVDGVFKTLKRQPEKHRTRGAFADNAFVKKLSLCIAAAFQKNNANDLVKALDKFFKDKGLDLKQLLKLSPKEFKKTISEKLKPQDINELKNILKLFADKLAKDMEKFKLKPTPKATESLKDDLYVNLFGLLNSAVAGGHAVPIHQFIGNGLGLADWNPNDGTAPIDWQNSLKDCLLGDPNSLNAATRQNYIRLDDSLAAEYQQVLRDEGLNPGLQQARLTR